MKSRVINTGLQNTHTENNKHSADGETGIEGDVYRRTVGEIYREEKTDMERQGWG